MGKNGKWSALALLVLGIRAELCLDDGVPEAQRQYIQDDAGMDMPIGFLVCAWQSSEFLTLLTSMLTEEVFGFHTRHHPVVGGNGAAPIYALAGCTDFNNVTDRGCHGDETQVHVSVDSWVGSYASAREKFNRENPRIASVDLGGMGYDGEESIYLRRSVLEAAYQDNGLPLDFYKSYNTTFHNPKQYFDSISSVNISELQLCNATQMSNTEAMGWYALYSGDYDGVVNNSQGDGYIANCPDGRLWFSPACRQDTSLCIPTFTAGDGWKLQAMMQWSTAYGIPAAIGISDGWSNFVSHVKSYRSLHYWWVPDSTFIEMQPAEVVFPRHSALEWAAGDKKTGGAGSYVSKMVSQNLQSKASKVQRFVAKITFELAEVQSLLLELTEPNATLRDTACKWIQNNKERWGKWKPVETNCDEGFGMIDGQGNFVDNRSIAVGCGLCLAGTASEEVLDNDGRTFQCKQCPPGYSQPNTYSSKCEPCPKGYISDSYGSKECSACSVSSYQPSRGQTACIPCHASRTTLVQGASSLADCVCSGGSIEDSNANCVECSIGLTCPSGSTLQKLEDRNLSVSTQSDYPTVESGFRANPESPLDIYKCAEPFACPGGGPGQCLDVRVGLTCGDCPDGQFWGSGACQECGWGVPVAWAVILVAISVGLVATYYSLTSKYTGKASTLMCTTGALGMLLGTMQNLGVLSTVSVPWPAGLGDILSFASIFTFDLDALGFACAAGGNVNRYAATALFFFGATAGLPAIGFLTNLVPCMKRKGLAWEKYKTISCTGQFLQVGFTTMCNVGLMPYMCYEHPTSEQSILKYPNVFCGTGDQVTMQIFGACVMCLALVFISSSCYAAWSAPKWSGKPRLGAIRFLIFRFRPNVWWFGLVLLARGPLLVLPGVVATNTPSLRLTLMNMILQTSLVLQVWYLPWKAPILNLVDALSLSLLVMLVNVALGYADNTGTFAKEVLQSLGTVISVSMLMILGFMICLGISALFYRAALGSQKELRVFTLGRVPNPKSVFRSMMDVAVFLKEEGQGMEDKLVGDLGNLSVYDLGLVHTCMNILADELEMQVSEHSMKSGIKRIASGQRRSHSRNSFGDRASAPKLSSTSSTGIATLEKDANESNEPVSIDDEKTKTADV